MSPERACKFGSIIHDFHADDHIDPPYSDLWVWGMNCILIYCLMRTFIFRARSLRLAREADVAVNPEAALVANARFVCGKVDFAEGQTNAISVEIEQAGSETRSKHGWTHRWTETARKTVAQPFYVRRPNGERIRIEPGKKPLLIDAPDIIVWKAKDKRTRIARLTAGEDVIVSGVLEEGHDPEFRQGADYRRNAQGWIMKPHRRSMEVCTEKLGERHRVRANSFRSTIVALFIAMGFVNLFFVYYQIRFWGGEDSCAQITKKDTSSSVDNKGRRTTYYNVNLSVVSPDESSIVRKLDSSDWNQLEVGNVIGFRSVPARPAMSELGTGTSTHYLTILFALFACAIGVGIYKESRDFRRWYEGKLEDTGGGPLPDGPTE